ncbi:MAG: hypothetical protein JWP97_1258 [Labilithrix sp.]|nr:hypothetical protein [Labilithrix sp.]
MGLLGRKKGDARTSRGSRVGRGVVTAVANDLSQDASVSAALSLSPVPVVAPLTALAASASGASGASGASSAPGPMSEPAGSEVRARTSPRDTHEGRETDSDVFLVRRKSRELPALSPELLAAAAQDAAVSVTLFVYGWENVQPGPLSWVFPSLRAALSAVKAMRNAIGWAIVSGQESTIDAARAKGAILIEQSS